MSPDSRPETEPNRSAPVLVTGGTGFVGSHLVEALAARGYGEVRCLVRKSPGWLAGLTHHPIRTDLSDTSRLSEAMEGCGLVFHVAARTRARTWDEFVEANVQGTLNVLIAAAGQPRPPRVQLVSSLAAVGRSDVPVADERTPLAPVSMYGRSKAEMEGAIESWQDRLDICVVRPPAVYGPRDSDILTVFKGAERGIFPVVGRADEPAVTLVHVSDLVAGMIDAAEAPVTRGRTYFLGADPAHTWTEMGVAAATAVGRRALTLRIPRSLIVPIGVVSELSGRLTGSHPPLNREKAMEIRDACTMCSSEAALSDFGYRATIGLGQGFRETADWYRREGWLRRRESIRNGHR